MSIGAVVLSLANLVYSGNVALLGYVAPPMIEGMAVAPETVRAGETVLVDWTIIKRTGCSGFNGRVWDGADHFHLSEPYRPTGLPRTDTPQKYRIETTIPAMAPPGPLTLWIEGEYTCTGRPAIPFRLGPVVMAVVE